MTDFTEKINNIDIYYVCQIITFKAFYLYCILIFEVLIHTYIWNDITNIEIQNHTYYAFLLLKRNKSIKIKLSVKFGYVPLKNILLQLQYKTILKYHRLKTATIINWFF